VSQRILVTGGAGFIGSNLCHELVKDGHEVFCLDNFSSGWEANIAHLRESGSFSCIEADVSAPGALPPVDEIYHLASRASPKDFIEHPVKIALSNTTGTKQLLEHARAADARLLFASTSEVYGDPEVHPQPESYSGNVNIRGPRGCYDESKRFGETLTVAYHRQYDLDVRTARIFNTYGPNMRPDDGRVVPNFVTQAIRGDDLTVYGDGSQTRSFCYIDDLIESLKRVMEEPEADGDVYNLGNENERTILELADLILEVTDSDSDITHEPLPEDDPSCRCPDISRAKEDLRWEPTVDLKTGLQQTFEYFEQVVK